MVESCYMCDAPSTTREHAPPLCVFPTTRDMGDGVNYRRDLITVPSCDNHNSCKSKDDEYLRAVLLHGFFNNDVGHKQFSTKLLRAVENSPAMYREIYRNAVPVTVNGIPTIEIEIDRDRFDQAVACCIRALHFSCYETKLLGDINAQSPLFIESDRTKEEEVNTIFRKFVELVTQRLNGISKQGENPQVFWFQIDNARNLGTTVGRLCFYGGFNVFFCHLANQHKDV